jgi:hypothetical protein
MLGTDHAAEHLQVSLNWCSESHALYRDMSEFISKLYIFPVLLQCHIRILYIILLNLCEFHENWSKEAVLCFSIN